MDCSAAFDLVSHQILLLRLEQCLRISGSALQWFIFLSHWLCVSITSTKSSASAPSSPLSCGDPQGLVPGMILFTIYNLTLGVIFRSHHTGFHLYANDSQLYLACDNTQLESVDQALARLEACIGDIRLWMPQNQLKGNKSFCPCTQNLATNLSPWGMTTYPALALLGTWVFYLMIISLLGPMSPL